MVINMSEAKLWIAEKIGNYLPPVWISPLQRPIPYAIASVYVRRHGQKDVLDLFALTAPIKAMKTA